MEVCLFSSLNTLRNEIIQIDDNIVRLIANRIDIVRDIGRIKHQLNLPIKNENVEKVKLKRLTELAKEMNISPDLISTIYLLVMNYAVTIQEEDRKSYAKVPQFVSNPSTMITNKSEITIGSDSP